MDRAVSTVVLNPDQDRQELCSLHCSLHVRPPSFQRDYTMRLPYLESHNEPLDLSTQSMWRAWEKYALLTHDTFETPIVGHFEGPVL